MSAMKLSIDVWALYTTPTTMFFALLHYSFAVRAGVPLPDTIQSWS